MNKHVTLFILVAILGAMILVFYNHLDSKPVQPNNAVQLPAVVNESATVGSFEPSQTNTSTAAGPNSPSTGQLETPQPTGQTSTAAPLAEAGQPQATQGQTQQEPQSGIVALAEETVRQSTAQHGTTATGSSTQPSGTVANMGQQTSAPQKPATNTAAPATSVAGPSPAPTANTTKPATTTLAETPKPTTQAAPPVAPAKPDKDSNKPLTIESISIKNNNGKVTLSIQTSGKFTPKVFELTAPDRLVVDLKGSWKNPQAPTVPDNALIKSARVGKQADGYRLVLDLKTKIKKRETSQSGNTLQIIMW